VHEGARAAGVTVALTCWNAAWCVERALDSVFAQTRPPEDVIITDDGSTDDTVERMRRRYGDRVRILELPHRGLTASRQAAIAAVRTPWFALLDADDWWMPERLERQLAFLERHPEVQWLSSDGAYVSADGVLRESWLSGYFDPVPELAGDLFPHVVRRCFPLVSSSLIRRDAYHAVGGLDDVQYSQDYALWLRLSARFPGGLLSDRLIAYWSSPGQLSRRTEERYRDDQRLMERVVLGEYRKHPEAQRIAREKVASYHFDLGVTCLRSGRFREGRIRLWRAALSTGPIRRRSLALLGALAPRWSLGKLMRSPWLKRTVSGARRDHPPMPGDIPRGMDA
jgi:glycosyltransferase involved in cell wall biosynthesis